MAGGLPRLRSRLKLQADNHFFNLTAFLAERCQDFVHIHYASETFL
jgi:hypothetical protein